MARSAGSRMNSACGASTLTTLTKWRAGAQGCRSKRTVGADATANSWISQSANGQHVLALLSWKRHDEFNLLCVGTHPVPGVFDSLPEGMVKTAVLTDESLAAAYSGATALLYPSAYEGFGLPVLEAMTCGCPVITTRNGAIPEVAGDAVMYLPEDSSVGLTDCLNRLANGATKELRDTGLRRASRFPTWKQVADRVRNAILDAATHLK